jgi:hypothetical protein
MICLENFTIERSAAISIEEEKAIQISKKLRTCPDVERSELSVFVESRSQQAEADIE